MPGNLRKIMSYKSNFAMTEVTVVATIMSMSKWMVS